MANGAQPIIVATIPPVRPQVTTRDVRMQLGPYRIVDLLGEGATGIVYRAVDPNDRELAIKVLREELVLSDRERARFLAEADRLRRVRHPALVEVVDAGVLPNGLPYIAMPYLHGASLCERLQRGPMRFDVALHLFGELAGALQLLAPSRGSGSSRHQAREHLRNRRARAHRPTSHRHRRGQRDQDGFEPPRLA